MDLLRFEWKKLIKSKWIFFLLLFPCFMSILYFFVNYNLTKTIRQETKEMIIQEGKQYSTLKDSLSAYNLPRTEEEQLTFYITALLDTIDTQVTSIDKRENMIFLDASLRYSNQKKEFYSLLNKREYLFTGKEKEKNYYLQTLKNAQQSYEDIEYSLLSTNFLYKLLKSIAIPFVLPIILLIFFSWFSFEKRYGSLGLMFLSSSSKNRYLRIHMLLTFALSQISLFLFLSYSLLTARISDVSFFASSPFQLNRIVDTNSQLQTIVTMRDVLAAYLLLFPLLVIFYQQIFYLCEGLISNMVVSICLYIVIATGIGGLLSKFQVVGNPFRLQRLSYFLYNEPNIVDLIFSVGMLVILCVITHLAMRKMIIKRVH
ncbi:hypothetical protein [Vagococcus acidifermentans]|uniref:Uncharacterized protein n=1 Tax=Vagococcus acidifermentans TaxID=564710 RepID=A0A430ARD2_9ENTE|nr:hypothetical protein [Vagococcus acidifermentans]RSU10610.1 hypothetical protein CBF27_09835 [Vagococcus acidifermentans]